MASTTVSAGGNGNLGPLTTTFTPSGGAICSSVWANQIPGGGIDLMYGAWDSRATDCFPPGFVPDPSVSFYSPGICPTGYTIMCSANAAEGVTAATCCASGYACHAVGNHDPAGCFSQVTATSSFTFNVSSFVSSANTWTSLSTTSMYTNPGAIVYAKGIVVRRASTDPTWAGSPASASATTTASSSQNSVSTSSVQSTGSPQSGGPSVSQPTSASNVAGPTATPAADHALSAAAGAGIAVGVIVFIALVGSIIALLLIRRRRARERHRIQKLQSDGQSTYSHGQNAISPATDIGLTDMDVRARYGDIEPSKTTELPVNVKRSELPSHVPELG